MHIYFNLISLHFKNGNSNRTHKGRRAGFQHR